MRRVLLLPSMLLLLLCGVCYLISGGTVRPASAGEKPIVFCTLDDIKTLDVAKMSWANDIRVAQALWEGLTTYDITDPQLKAVPAAARSIDLSDDGKTYTFHLRPEARWSNGDPLTARDFLFAWRRVLTPATGADYINLLDDIEGAKEYTAALEKYAADVAAKRPASLPDPVMVRVEAPDEGTLVVHLKAPCTYFLDLLAMPVYMPLHEKSMQPFLVNAREQWRGYDASFTRPPHLVTNGAFQLSEWKFKQYLSLTPNPVYWDRRNVKCAELQIRAAPDGRTALLMYQTGAADVLSFIPQEFADVMLQQHYQQQQWPEIHHQPVFGDYYYVFNCARKPFDDKRVRRALSMAIDREQIVRMLNTGQKAMGLIVPPDSIAGYTSPPQQKSDLGEARRLLAEAGYPGGQGMKSVEILFNTESSHSRVAQAIAQMWQTNLGITVSLRGLERGSFGTARRVNHDFDVARGGWYGDYPDPTTWLDLLRTDNGNNDGKFSSPAFDELMARTDRESRPAERLRLLRQAEDMLVNDEVPLLPIYQVADGYIYDAGKIAGAQMNVRMITELKWIRRK